MENCRHLTIGIHPMGNCRNADNLPNSLLHTENYFNMFKIEAIPFEIFAVLFFLRCTNTCTLWRKQPTPRNTPKLFY